MITYTWNFTAFDCKVQEEEMEKVVTTVHWRYKGIDENDVTAEIYGAQSVGEPTPDTFIPYPDLTEEQVIGWMEGVLDVEEMQDNIANQIDLIANPVTITLPPPFDKI
jgi:hypothetical protein